MAVSREQVAHVDLTPPIVANVYYHSRMKEYTVGNGGAYWTAESTYHKTKFERQVTGYLGEAAMFIYLYGHYRGAKMFDDYRHNYNQNPRQHDNGNDVLNMDVKTRRVIKSGDSANWHKYPIKCDILNFECLIRPQHVYGPDHRYALVIVEYDDALLSGRVQNVQCDIIGWGKLRDATHHPSGNAGIRGNHYALTSRQMTPMEQFTINILERNRNERQSIKGAS